MKTNIFDIIDEYAASAELDTACELMNDCIKTSMILEQFGYDESNIPEEFLMEAATNGGPGIGTRIRARNLEHRVKAGRAIDQANERLERRPGERLLVRFLLFIPRLIMAIINFFRGLIRRLSRGRNTVQSAASAVSSASSNTRSTVNSSWSVKTFTSSISSGQSLSASVRSALSTSRQLPGPVPGNTSSHSGSSSGPSSGSSRSRHSGPLTTGHQLPGSTSGRSTTKALPMSDSDFEQWANQAKSTEGNKGTPIKDICDEQFANAAKDAIVTGKFKGLPILNKKFMSALNDASKTLDDLNDWCGRLERGDNKISSSGGHINDHGDKFSVNFNQVIGWTKTLEKKSNNLGESYKKMADALRPDKNEKTSFTGEQLTQAYDTITKTLNHMNDVLQKLEHEVSGSGDSQLARMAKACKKKGEEFANPQVQAAYLSGVKALAEALTKMKEGVAMTAQALDYTVHCCELVLELIKQAGGNLKSQRTVGFSTAVRNERGELRDSERIKSNRSHDNVSAGV